MIIEEDAWVFTKEDLKATPSRADGITEDRETQYRTCTCAFIWSLGTTAKFPLFAIATGIVFFHRFFILNSFKAYDQSIVGATCLFLAGKVEECPKKLNAVVSAYHKMKNPSAKLLDESSKAFWELKDAILVHERIVLHELCFDLNVVQPYKFLMSMVLEVDSHRNGTSADTSSVTPQGKRLCEIAWNFTNDSLRTTLSLQYNAETIALGTIHLAFKFLKWECKVDESGKQWYDLIAEKWNIKRRGGDINQTLEDISTQILDLYERAKVKSASENGDGKPQRTAAPPAEESQPTAPARPPAPAPAPRPPLPKTTAPPKGQRWVEGLVYTCEGSGPDPYRLALNRSVYSCTCVAWRHFGGPENMRTCKHLRMLRGDTAERARVGGASIKRSDDQLKHGINPRPSSESSQKRPADDSAGNAHKRPRENGTNGPRPE